MADNKNWEQKTALWIQNHLKAILFGTGFVCILGLSTFAWVQWERHQEKQVHDRIYIYRSALEKAHKKANGENHKRGVKNIADFFKPKKETPFVYSDDMKAKAGKYEEAIKKDQKTLAAAAAAIDLADFYYQAGEREKARSLLSLFSHGKRNVLSVLFEEKKSSSVYTLLRLQLAGFYMDEKNCEKALPLLSLVANTKHAEPFHSETWLQMGLCYEQLKDSFKVEETYGKIREQYPESSVAQTAEVYLRLFKISQKYKE